jgi:hypothetical protein
MKIKYKNLIFLSFLIFVLYQLPVFSLFSGGSGTEADPYQITSREDMEELADSVNNGNRKLDNFSRNKYFILMNDITDSVRTVIADNVFSSLQYSQGFRGTFDGQGHTITVAMNHTLERDHSALFGYTVNATIKNIAVTGYINGIVVASIVVLAGKNTTITNCLNSANLIAENVAGGIVTSVGATNNVVIKNCINIGTIKSKLFWAGGILGNQDDYNYLDENNNNCDGNILVTNCINSGFIEGNDNVGGIVGYNLFATISNCISTGVVKGNTKVGCIVGENNGGTIINCHYDKQMCSGGE